MSRNHKNKIEVVNKTTQTTTGYVDIDTNITLDNLKKQILSLLLLQSEEINNITLYNTRGEEINDEKLQEFFNTKFNDGGNIIQYTYSGTGVSPGNPPILESLGGGSNPFGGRRRYRRKTKRRNQKRKSDRRN